MWLFTFVGASRGRLCDSTAFLLFFCRAVPVWASIVIALLTLMAVVLCCGCICKICWKKRKDRGFRKGLKSAVDLRSVQILSSTLKDKV